MSVKNTPFEKILSIPIDWIDSDITNPTSHPSQIQERFQMILVHLFQNLSNIRLRLDRWQNASLIDMPAY